MDRILVQYITSKFFNDIVAQYNPLAIFLTGSRAVGVYNEDSDYDICVLLDIRGKPDESYPSNNNQLIYKETSDCLHYCSLGLDELFVNVRQGRSAMPTDQYLWKALIEFGLGDEPLYVREDFKEAWKKIETNRRTIAKASLYEMYKECAIGDKMLDIAFKYGDLLPVRDIVYALVEYALVTDTEIPPEDVKRMKEIRKMSPEQVDGLDLEEKNRYIAKMAYIANEFNFNSAIYESYKNQADEIYMAIRQRGVKNA